MARMYPSPMNPETKSEAERLLYRAFHDELDESYVIFHGRAWQATDRDGRPRDGEADFVIVHPERGVLVLEAKGGTIRHDPHTDAWTSIDSSGHLHPIKDPFAQARNSRYALEDALRMPLKQRAAQGRTNLGYAVAFPDAVVSAASLGLDKPREIILDCTDLADLSAWVGRALAYWRGQETQRQTAPGEKVVQNIVELLGAGWELRPALWGQLVQERQDLIRLTEQQFQILDILNRQRRALICGCAGSGKTMLAVEKATRLARQGFHVLLTCFNRNLATDLRARLKPLPNLDILHFHGLCFKLAEQAGVLPVQKSTEAFFSYELPEALDKATAILDTRYDAIIADEGQDFQEHWWIPLHSLLHDQDHGILYVFYDDNQRLYVQRSSFPISQEPYCLTVNCRNTQSIHRLVVQFYDADVRPTARGPVGRPVELVSYNGPQGLRPALMHVLQKLIEDELIPAMQIAVLSPLSQKSEFWADAANRKWRLTDAWPPSVGQVYFSSIYGFKGLERPVIIMVEMEHWHTDLVPLLYVGCSRASNHLVVLLPKDAGPEMQEAFAVAQSLQKSF
jgi:hypothetical protein